MFASSTLDGASSLISKPPVDGIKLVSIDGKGRGVVTTRFFQPGEVIILETPYAAVPTLGEIHNCCSTEFTRLPEDSATKCSGCKSVRYSSREAQKADWNAGHKLECKKWQQLRASGECTATYIPDSLPRLLCRILWRREWELKQKMSNHEVPFWQSFGAISALVDHTAASSGMTVKKRMMINYVSDSALLFAKHSQLPLEHIDREDASILLSKIKANCLHILLDQGDTMGLGLYPFCAMLNHSDKPNAYHSFRGGKMQVRALAPIQKGEEICITYRHLEEPSFDRRRHLVSNFCFDNRPDLPRTEKMPELHSQELSPPIRACILDGDVSKLLAQNEADRMLCALDPHLMKVVTGPQFCWICVTSRKIEADWAKDSPEVAERYLKEVAAAAPDAPAEDDRGELESWANADQVRSVLAQGWSRADAHEVEESSENGALRTSRWQQQVADEGWSMVARLFGDWSSEGADYTSPRWLEVASAAAFGMAGIMWAERMLDGGERELAREMLLAVEAAGEDVGLAGSHQVMLQARSELIRFYVKESNSLEGSFQSEEQKAIMATALKYCNLTIDAKEHIYPEAWYELGWSYRTLGDCHAISLNMDEAVEWWAKAYECLHTLLGPTPEVQSIRGRLLVQTAGDSREKLEEAIKLLQGAL